MGPCLYRQLRLTVVSQLAQTNGIVVVGKANDSKDPAAHGDNKEFFSAQEVREERWSPDCTGRKRAKDAVNHVRICKTSKGKLSVKGKYGKGVVCGDTPEGRRRFATHWADEASGRWGRRRRRREGGGPCHYSPGWLLDGGVSRLQQHYSEFVWSHPKIAWRLCWARVNTWLSWRPSSWPPTCTSHCSVFIVYSCSYVLPRRLDYTCYFVFIMTVAPVTNRIPHQGQVFKKREH